MQLEPVGQDVERFLVSRWHRKRVSCGQHHQCQSPIPHFDVAALRPHLIEGFFGDSFEVDEGHRNCSGGGHARNVVVRSRQRDCLIRNFGMTPRGPGSDLDLACFDRVLLWEKMQVQGDLCSIVSKNKYKTTRLHLWT